MAGELVGVELEEYPVTVLEMTETLSSAPLVMVVVLSLKELVSIGAEDLKGSGSFGEPCSLVFLWDMKTHH